MTLQDQQVAQKANRFLSEQPYDLRIIYSAFGPNYANMPKEKVVKLAEETNTNIGSIVCYYGFGRNIFTVAEIQHAARELNGTDVQEVMVV